MNTNTKPTERAADIVAALMKAPRTLDDLLEYLGVVPEHAGTKWHVQRYLDALHAVGVARVSDYAPRRGPPARVWAMQASPFALPDAQRPPKVRKGVA